MIHRTWTADIKQRTAQLPAPERVRLCRLLLLCPFPPLGGVLHRPGQPFLAALVQRDGDLLDGVPRGRAFQPAGQVVQPHLRRENVDPLSQPTAWPSQ